MMAKAFYAVIFFCLVCMIVLSDGGIFMKQIQGQMSIFDFIQEPEPEPEIIRNPPVHRYLRYGPHTLIPEVRDETRKYLEQNGVPDWVKWDKGSLPCSNCTWYDGHVCKGGGHTCHYEFGYLICDGFYQSIVERKPSTVGENCPSLIKTKSEPVTMFGKEWHPLEEKPEGITEYDDLEILGPYPWNNKENWSCCPAHLEDGQIIAMDVPWDIPRPKWKYWRLKEKVFPVDIMGLCDDAYC